METRLILLAEDNLVIQKVHCHYLESMGYTIDVANNGKQALALYQPGKYCMVILDSGLPDTTGFDLAKIIRAKEIPGQWQYLILFSALDYEYVKTQCAEAGIDDFAIKPIKPEVLEIMVSNALPAAKIKIFPETTNNLNHP
jgi:CheY-like chemotaxis protein